MKKESYNTDNTKFTIGDLLKEKGFNLTNTNNEESETDDVQSSNNNELSIADLSNNSKIRVIYQRKGRANNPVTIIKGLDLDEEKIKILAKIIKQKLAVGGTIDNNEIILQGDQVDKVIEFLTSLKFNDVKKG